MKKILLSAMLLLAAGGAWLAWQLESRPSLEPYLAMAAPAASSPTADDGLRVTFLGVSTLLVRDGDVAVLVDGFFTRPGLLDTALFPLAPDADRIDRALERAGIERLDAVVTVHSHYDHAMDSPLVAERTGAVLIGSATTAWIARGQGLPEERLRVVDGAASFRFGGMSVSLVPSRHFPHGQAMGELDAPLAVPARATEFLEGGSFSIHFESRGHSILVQGSAGYVEGALAGRRADVVYLGVGLLGSKDAAYREAYWREVVTAVGARRVVPIHWDDFTRSLDEPLAPLPYLLDDLDASMAFLAAAAERDGVELQWPVTWVASDPLAGL